MEAARCHAPGDRDHERGSRDSRSPHRRHPSLPRDRLPLRSARRRFELRLLAAALALLPGAASGQEISPDPGALGSLLRRWAAEGTAAGNRGDRYENRDGGHSPLDLARYPQLRAVDFSQPADRAEGAEGAGGADAEPRGWALRLEPLPGVVFGNSSTAGSAPTSGSNARRAYAERGGLEALVRQYRANNLYVYPEHQDHDAGGHGDVFPTNTPYLIISQGSSGSDRPFLEAIATTLAAFRPEVKARLVESGLLMPTLQLILRVTSRRLGQADDYLTGIAHPTVFEGAALDPLAMARRAHAIRLETLPPMVGLELVEADGASQGIDYFDAARSETLARTESVIARVYRSIESRRRLVVSAEQSFDPNGRELTFHWRLLRGDPERVKIRRLDPRGARAEITYDYHPRAPIRPGHPLESNRVDVGVFVHNGASWSAPGFVTSYSLANEMRHYDAEGRLLELGYGHGVMRLALDDAPRLLAFLTGGERSARLVREALGRETLRAIEPLAKRYREADGHLQVARRERRVLESRLVRAPAESRYELGVELGVARASEERAEHARDQLLERRPIGVDTPLSAYLHGQLERLALSSSLRIETLRGLGPVPAIAERERARLVGLGILEPEQQHYALRPLLPGNGPPEERLSAFQREQLTRLRGTWLAFFLPGVGFEYERRVVDFALTLRKDWRDVYTYDASGARLGWTRYLEDGGAPREFTAEGILVLSRDAQGRPASGTGVVYGIPERARKRAPWLWPALSFDPAPPAFRIDYAGATDRRGVAVPVRSPETPGEGPH